MTQKILQKGTALILFAVISICLPKLSLAQISQGGTPYSFSAEFEQQFPNNTLTAIDLEAPNINDLMAEDERGEPHPNRFAAPIHVGLNPYNSGQWYDLQNGDRLWILRVKATDALSLHPIFDDFFMPIGGKLHIYSADKNQVLGAYTSINNLPNREFMTWYIQSDDIFLEFYEPADIRDKASLHIGRFDYGYRQFFLRDGEIQKSGNGFGDSGACNINVNCPLGVDWQDEKRGVALMMSSSAAGSGFCTGSLINNTNEDATPYFLTADHCGGPAPGGTVTWVFLFNYEAVGCTNPATNPYPGTVSTSVSGATIRAKRAASDVSLVEFNTPVPLSYNPYYNGWNRNTEAATEAVGIHHPSGDIKKICKDNNPPTTASFGGPPANHHWRTVWDEGTTEPGSSGSPLFDQNGRIIGQLHGGAASCTNLLGPDFYGKFDLSWDAGGTPATQLKDWLDPCNLGYMVLDGYDPNTSTTAELPRAIKLEGASEYIEFPNTTPKPANFTLEAWVYPEVGGTVQSIFAWGNATQSATLRLNADSRLEYEETGSPALTGISALPLNTWTHVAIRKTGTNAEILINGNSEGTATIANIAAPTAVVGGANVMAGTPSDFFEGLIDEVRLWSVVRTDVQIQNDLHTDFTAAPTGIVSLWNFDDGAGITAADAFGSNDATLIGGASWQAIAPSGVNITGENVVCASTSESYQANTTGCTPFNDYARYSYNWTATGGTISDGQATPEVTIDWGALGMATLVLNVTHSNSSLTLPTQNFNVTIDTPPATAPTITADGPTTFCNDEVTLTAIAPIDNYLVENIAFNKEDISATGTSITLGDDAVSAALPVGFTFNFYGNDYTQFYIGSNGLVAFGGTAGVAGAWNPQNIPNAANPNNLIAISWADLNPALGGTIRYQTLGTAPNRRLIVDFDAVAHFGAAATTATTQAILYEGTNIIEIHSENIMSDGTNRTMGVENQDGTQAVAVPGRNRTVWGATNDGKRFKPTSSLLTWIPTGENTLSITVNDDEAIAYSVNFGTGSCVTTSSEVFVSSNCSDPPVVDNPTLTDIEATSAVLGAEVVSTGGGIISERGIVWSITAGATTIGAAGANVVPEGGSGLGIFSDLIAGLPAGVTIYFRGYATNSAGTDYTEEISFTTPTDTTPPTLISTTPADGATEVSITTDLTLTFSESINGTAGAVIELYHNDGTLIESFDISGISGLTTFSLTPATALDESTAYYVMIPSTAIEDLAGNAFAGLTTTTDWTFTTVSPATGGGGSTPPAEAEPVTNFTAVAQNTSSILLTWRASANAERYALYRQAQGSSEWVRVSTFSAGVREFLDTNLESDTRYRYRLDARLGVDVASAFATEFTYPEAPALSIAQNACSTNPVARIAAESTHQSGLINWYANETESERFTQTQSIFQTPEITETTTFYATAQGQKYESEPRVSVTISIVETPVANLSSLTTRN
ncbi:MAG: Ig-like domain-containing protein, partial [Bernardetiaceae bacterium]|nr:Ig-like domain-containing protein [Bernardetiaceae bacterium]